MAKNRGRVFLAFFGLVALCLTSESCQRQPPIEAKKEPPATPEEARGSVSPTEEVYAAWYDVPESSLAKGRAGAEELTAAHNRLPLGTRVRVTNSANGKSVLVRITDRGITDKRVEIDLCREAARELDMISEGIAKVRMNVLPNE